MTNRGIQAHKMQRTCKHCNTVNPPGLGVFHGDNYRFSIELEAAEWVDEVGRLHENGLRDVGAPVT